MTFKKSMCGVVNKSWDWSDYKIYISAWFVGKPPFPHPPASSTIPKISLHIPTYRHHRLTIANFDHESSLACSLTCLCPDSALRRWNYDASTKVQLRGWEECSPQREGCLRWCWGPSTSNVRDFDDSKTPGFLSLSRRCPTLVAFGDSLTYGKRRVLPILCVCCL